jgi:hypothetical protein
MPAKENVIYRTKDNRADYHFVFETQSNGSERAYILRQPSYTEYGQRDSDAHTTHRYYDGNKEMHYICIDPNPTSRTVMKNVAKIWAENTEIYRRTGRRF